MNSTDFGRFGRCHYYFRSYATEVFSLKAVIEEIETKYLDGHSVLWKSQAKELNDHVAWVERFATLWTGVIADLDWEERSGRGKRVKDGISPLELDFDLKVLKGSINPIERTTELVNRAAVEALQDVGDWNEGYKFTDSWLRTML